MNDPNRDFNEVIRTIRQDDPRYARGAYYFLRQALDYSLKELHKRGDLDRSNHLTGQQLLEGIRLFALDQYGPMARTVLEHWGVKPATTLATLSSIWSSAVFWGRRRMIVRKISVTVTTLMKPLTVHFVHKWLRQPKRPRMS